MLEEVQLNRKPHFCKPPVNKGGIGITTFEGRTTAFMIFEPTNQISMLVPWFEMRLDSLVKGLIQGMVGRLAGAMQPGPSSVCLFRGNG